MTTVAFDGKMLASDSRVVGHYVIDDVKKLFEIGDTFYGFAGHELEGILFIDWLNHKECEPPKLEHDLYVLEVVGNKVFYWEKNLVRVPRSVPCAIGSGAMIAITAMHCGKTAIEAVKMAKSLDENTGGNIQSVATTERSAIICNQC